MAPLDGLRILDFSHVIAGPFATQILGDLGATVTKVESVGVGDVGRRMAPTVNGQSHYFVCFNRNKRSIEIDLKSPEGKAIAHDLIRSHDVVVENFGPGVVERLGLDFPTARAINPSVIYCSISGFGRTGPLSEKRTYDLVTQAYSGLMSANGEPGSAPLKIGVPIGDTAGSLFAVISILSALLGRREDSSACHLDVAMYDCLLALLANHGGHYLATGRQTEKHGSSHYFSVPNGVFPVTDGYVAIAVNDDNQWVRLCGAIGRDDLAADPAFATLGDRDRNRDRLIAALVETFKTWTMSGLVGELDKAGVPCGPVNSIGAALEHPQAAARHMVVDLNHPTYGTARAISLPVDRTLLRDRFDAPPLLGEHTRTVLHEIGMTDERVDELVRQGVIGMSGLTPEETQPSRDGAAKQRSTSGQV